MRFEEIKELIEIFEKSTLTKLEIDSQESQIKLQREGSSKNYFEKCTTTSQMLEASSFQNRAIENVTIEDEQKECNSLDIISSPMVGTFYTCPSPKSPAYVKEGDSIKKGDIVAIIEAMKIMNEIEAEFDCTIVSVACEDGQPVEYGAPLFRVKRI